MAKFLDFNPSAAAKPAQEVRPVIGVDNQYRLSERMIADGSGVGKTSLVTAYKMPPMVFETLAADGNHETTQAIKFEGQFYISFDSAPDKWPIRSAGASNRFLATESVIQDLGRKWANKVIRINTTGSSEDIQNMLVSGALDDEIEAAVAKMVAAELGMPDLSEKGVYISKAGKQGQDGFEFDYVPTEPGVPVYAPNPEAKRVAFQIDPREFPEGVTIMAPWGQPFYIGPNGHFLVREKDVPAFVDAMRKTRAGALPEQTIFNEDGVPYLHAEKRVADAYGAHPDFVLKNYGPVDLSPETQALQAEVGSWKIYQRPAAPAVAKRNGWTWW